MALNFKIGDPDFKYLKFSVDKSEILTREQTVRMIANLHNPRQELVAMKPGASEPIPHKIVEEIKV